MTQVYLVMDGRARYDLDRALVCTVADTLEEARADRPMYGDAVIVRADVVGNELRNLELVE